MPYTLFIVPRLRLGRENEFLQNEISLLNLFLYSLQSEHNKNLKHSDFLCGLEGIMHSVYGSM